MARKPLLECHFYIPIHGDKNLSDGQPHSAEAWEWLEGKLYGFGGATKATQLYEGWYVDRDMSERVDDQSWRYEVALPRKQLRQLRAMLREACVVFQQKCIYLSVAGLVEFVEGPGDETG